MLIKSQSLITECSASVKTNLEFLYRESRWMNFTCDMTKRQSVHIKGKINEDM